MVSFLLYGAHFSYIGSLVLAVQAVRNLFHLHKWSEELKRTCTISSALPVSSARDSFQLGMNFI